MKITVFAAASLLAVSAQAQLVPAPAPPTCAPFEEALRMLQRDWHEQPIALAQADQAGPLVVLAAPDGASWTILVLRPDGQACIAATGQRWQPIALPVGEPS